MALPPVSCMHTCIRYKSSLKGPCGAALANKQVMFTLHFPHQNALCVLEVNKSFHCLHHVYLLAIIIFLPFVSALLCFLVHYSLL